ncbi:MAG: glycosyltransferase family 4 protein [Deltaproteobacteria bacterium]|nr:glycosyltransferase family 4 protein [Deltaproteobacteria bacterium]
MKIAFIIGSPALSGGLYVVLQHAAGLAARGHAVDLLTERKVSPQDFKWHDLAQRLSFRTLDESSDTQYDIALSTWWETVLLLPKVRAARYASFVQSIESRFYPASQELQKHFVEATYALNLPVITEARWIQELLRNDFGRSVFLARNGIRKDIYTASGPAIERKSPGKLRVLVEGPLDLPFKNVLRTLEICAESAADEVWLLTSTPNTTSVPNASRVFSCVPVTETAAIYRSCDVLVKLSSVEGMFGPPLEMFHCGGTAIVYDVSGSDEYIRHGENAIVVAQGDEAGVLAAINKLHADPLTLAGLKAAALKTAQAWPSWEAVATEFEQALRAVQEEPPASATRITELAKAFQLWRAQTIRFQDDIEGLRQMESHLRSVLDARQLKLDSYVANYHQLLESPLLKLLQKIQCIPGSRYIGALVRACFPRASDRTSNS